MLNLVVRESLGLEAFGELWQDLVRRAVHGEEEFADDHYLAQLMTLVHALRGDEIPRMGEPGYQREGLASGGVWGDGEVGLIELTLEPGAVIPAHNHVAYNFLSLCLEGDLEYRHYSPVDAPDPASEGTSDWFRVEQVKGGILEPGRVTTLGRTWDNIHWFRAGKHGAVLIDFMTHLPDPGEGYHEFSALEVADEFLEEERLEREARWIGNPFR